LDHSTPQMDLAPGAPSVDSEPTELTGVLYTALHLDLYSPIAEQRVRQNWFLSK